MSTFLVVNTSKKESSYQKESNVLRLLDHVNIVKAYGLKMQTINPIDLEIPTLWTLWQNLLKWSSSDLEFQNLKKIFSKELKAIDWKLGLKINHPKIWIKPILMQFQSSSNFQPDQIIWFIFNICNRIRSSTIKNRNSKQLIDSLIKNLVKIEFKQFS